MSNEEYKATGKPFGYVVRASCCGENYRSVYRQRVFQNEHDQAQCYRQWMEHFERVLTTTSSGIWWEISKHTVYEA